MSRERIRLSRKELGLSLSKAADLIGITKSYLWSLENSDDANPSVKVVCKLAKAYLKPLDYFYSNKADTSNRESFIAASKPLIKWLNKNSNPHATVLVTQTWSELLLGDMIFRHKEKDGE